MLERPQDARDVPLDAGTGKVARRKETGKGRPLDLEQDLIKR